MLKIENAEVVGWEAAIRGMRNPMNSWEKSDSGYCMDTIACHTCMCNRNLCKKNMDSHAYVVGIDDYNLMKKLAKAGTDHRKFMRFIDVYLDITAPLYWWKEFDTYRAGVMPGESPNPMDIEMNSCSTMHKIHCEPITEDLFSFDHVELCAVGKQYLEELEKLRIKFVERKDKKYWYALIQLLPQSFNQRRTIKLNYEVLANIYKSRRHHKLDEWHVVCDWIKTLPYSKLITGEEDLKSSYADQPGLALGA